MVDAGPFRAGRRRPAIGASVRPAGRLVTRQGRNASGRAAHARLDEPAGGVASLPSDLALTNRRSVMIRPARAPSTAASTAGLNPAQRRRSSVRGSRGAEPPGQPQCSTLGKLAPDL